MAIISNSMQAVLKGAGYVRTNHADGSVTTSLMGRKIATFTQEPNGSISESKGATTKRHYGSFLCFEEIIANAAFSALRNQIDIEQRRLKAADMRRLESHLTTLTAVR